MTEQDLQLRLGEQLRRAVYLALGELGEAFGRSRLGGRPDLTADLAWPADKDGTPLTPLLQFNLQDVPAFEANPFPAGGPLSVFVGLDEPAPDVAHHVFLVDPATTLQQRELPAESTASDTFSEVTPHHLKLTLGLDPPRWATSQEERLTEAMDNDQQSAYWKLVQRLDPPGTLGRLLGHAARQDAYAVREYDISWLYPSAKRAELDINRAERWQHFLTLNSVMALDLSIWDAGYLPFLIKDDPLRGLDFGQVDAAVETS